MAGVHIRDFEAPDEVRPFDQGHMARVDVGGVGVWQMTFEPGWRFCEHVDPDPCPAPHAAYVLTGRLHVLMEDGTEAEAGPGEVIVISPGHDAWTVGDEACVIIDFAESVPALA
jgi:quercetin dioxygenase-like cupin family protein